MLTRSTIGSASSRPELAFALIGALAIATACSDDGGEPAPAEPLFPADYAATFQEVRSCRRSADHDLFYVRVLASAGAASVYANRDAPFPEGSVLVKEEHADDACTDLERITAMRREIGYAPQAGDWHWQRLSPDRAVELDGKLATCAGCHQSCGVPPDGHDWTCAAP